MLMNYTLDWYDDTCTVIVAAMIGHWTWDDHFNAVQEAYAMISAVPHEVDVIVTGVNNRMPGGRMLEHIEALREGRPRNFGVLVLVSNNRLLRTMHDLFTRFYRSTTPLLFAQSLNDALNLLDESRT